MVAYKTRIGGAAERVVMVPIEALLGPDPRDVAPERQEVDPADGVA